MVENPVGTLLVLAVGGIVGFWILYQIATVIVKILSWLFD